MKVRELLRLLGPSIVVASVVLGPGSIMTSSKVGADYGWMGMPVLLVAVVLMIGMVALSARLGVVYKGSICDELSDRLGRGIAIAVAVALFLIVALFQSSNNVAVIGGIVPLLGEGAEVGAWTKISILLGLNAIVVWSLYAMRSLYGLIEKAMKALMLFMVVAFLLNFVAVIFGKPVERMDTAAPPEDMTPLIGLVATTFSIAGAFFQAYLVKEKGWGMKDLRKGTVDSVLGISVLGGVTAIILMTSILVFYKTESAQSLLSITDVSKQLVPFFGSWAPVIFGIGFLAGGLSSFLVNAVIGGTVMADGLGKGSRVGDPWSRHLTTAALVTGFAIATVGIIWGKESTANLIIFAQALTVLGMPALGLALVYLATRRDFRGERKVPGYLIGTASVGTVVVFYFAVQKGISVWKTLAG